MIKAAIYTRFSSDMQRDQSIEDQMRLCMERAQSEQWAVYNCYSDAGISGASMHLRPGIQMLLQEALAGKFNVVLCEALDRLSRDLNDISNLYKQLEFAGVKIITLSEGEITTMHIGLKGTMNELALKDLADKTRRGLRGKIENALSGGGIAYGYKVVKKFDARGEALKGEREIDEEKATIVRRIFSEYAAGKSPKAITAQLNEERIPNPSGKTWSHSTINGNRKRGTGILNNELYIGRLIWNRQHFIKDPATGKRVTRMNPESEWVIAEVPELRIVPQDLWDKAKARQKTLDRKAKDVGANTSDPCVHQRRPRYLLSGLLKCGVCGGGFSKMSVNRYGCSNARNKGASICSNSKTIRRDVLEETILNTLQHHLMEPELVKVFCEEYTKHRNELRKVQNSALHHAKSELAKLEKERQGFIEAIKAGVPGEEVKDSMIAIAERRKELEAFVESRSEQDTPILMPSMAQHYRKEVEALRDALNDENLRNEAAELLRSLVDKIVLTPKKGQKELAINLYGDLAGILSIAVENTSGKKQDSLVDQVKALASNDNDPDLQIKMVAGAGFEPTTFGL
ncbi:MAG: recombinase family protein [Micavibrio sp.]|nr:recombinase family protein [Micavibrio sp.]